MNTIINNYTKFKWARRMGQPRFVSCLRNLGHGTCDFFYFIIIMIYTYTHTRKLKKM